MISYPSGLFHFLMAEIDWLQQIKNRNYDEDIVLRMPSLSSGERIISAAFGNPIDSFNSIMGIAYPENGRKIQIGWEIYI